MKYKYSVTWNGDITNYKQNFDTLEEARAAMKAHASRGSVLKIEFSRADE